MLAPNYTLCIITVCKSATDSAVTQHLNKRKRCLAGSAASDSSTTPKWARTAISDALPGSPWHMPANSRRSTSSTTTSRPISRLGCLRCRLRFCAMAPCCGSRPTAATSRNSVVDQQFIARPVSSLCGSPQNSSSSSPWWTRQRARSSPTPCTLEHRSFRWARSSSPLTKRSSPQPPSTSASMPGAGTSHSTMTMVCLSPVLRKRPTI